MPSWYRFRGRWLPALLAAILFSPLPAAAQEPPFEELVETCGSCHGMDGNSTTPEIPSLAGQPRTFIETQMIFFRERLRQSEIMTPQAQGLSDATIGRLADHFSALAPTPEPGPPDEALMEQGRALAREGRCGTCHLPSYAGRQQMPRLAGQREEYLVQAMRAYRDATRRSPDTTMVDIMRGVPDEDIKALAHFLAHQPLEPSE